MVCDICGAEEGELHRYFWCLRETCPFCGGKLVSCDCIYDMTYLRNREKYLEKYQFLSKRVYENGPPEEAIQRFRILLNAQGRIPFSARDFPTPET